MASGPIDAYDELRTTLKGRIFWVLFPLFLVFTYYVYPVPPQSAQAGAKEAGGLLGPLDGLLGVVARVVSAGVLAPAFSFLLSATDPLFHGDSRQARFIQKLLPSNPAKAKYNCSEAEATDLWFLYFDTWEHAKSPNTRLMTEASKRTYGARLIFYLEQALSLFGIAGALILLVAIVLPSTWHPFGEHIPVRVTMLIAVGVVLAYLHISNPVRRGPWGCWRKVAEAFRMQRLRFEREVLDHAGTLPEAIVAVERIRKNLERESSPKPAGPVQPPAA